MVEDLSQEVRTQSAPVDIFGQGAHEDPYALYREARSGFPVCFNEATGTYALVSYEDVSRVLRDPVTFANGGGGVDGPRNNYGSHRGRASDLILAGDDDPRHKHLRQILGPTLSPSRIRKLREDVAQIVNSLVDEIVVGESFDATTMLANPLPLRVLARFLGVPEDDGLGVFGWVIEILTQSDAVANEAQLRFDKYFHAALKRSWLDRGRTPSP